MTSTHIEHHRLMLLPDDPATSDLLSFDAVAQTVADALLDESLDPVALGLSGPWGSGKTTVLNLVAAEMERRSEPDSKILLVNADPWRYDPAMGAKESLISEVLAALASEIAASATKTDKAAKLLKRLGSRINWAKALKVAASASLALQIPSIDELVDLVKAKEDDNDDSRGLDAFRAEYAELISSEDLHHIRSVVVLVDDLDRCLPETVVDSLEAMRLFLAVPRMSFVIAADEDRVADAIRNRLKTTGAPMEDDRDSEDPAHLYLHKIVQTMIPLPALSHFDTQAYLLLLLMSAKASPEHVDELIASCAAARSRGGTVDDISVPGLTFVDELAFASRLTPLLYEKVRGNPRRIKRFLNDLSVRQSVASRRGITLDAEVVAKLMALEVLMPSEFRKLLDWFGKGIMRDQLSRLDAQAGQPVSSDDPMDEKEGDPAEDAKRRKAKTPTDGEAPIQAAGEFSDAMLRWAKLNPSLQGVEIAPYLTLAASFAGVTLVDSGLPERLRDIAANLLSQTRAEQSAVRDSDLNALGDGDGTDLLLHIGRTLRDQPSRQKPAVTAILRIGRHKPALSPVAADALRKLPPGDLSVGTPLLFRADDSQDLRNVLSSWRDGTNPGPVRAALDNAIAQRAGA